MISRTGKGCACGGFTLIEVMVAVAVLSLGLVMIYQAFFSSLHSLNYVSDRLNVDLEINNKIWELEDRVNSSMDSVDVSGSGEVKYDNRRFAWKASSSLIDGTAGLYKTEVTFSWMDRAQKNMLTRCAYVGK